MVIQSFFHPLVSKKLHVYMHVMMPVLRYGCYAATALLACGEWGAGGTRLHARLPKRSRPGMCEGTPKIGPSPAVHGMAAQRSAS
jgi:hypothetical protein